MASRVLTKRVMYLPNLRAAVNHVRAFSWHRDGDQTETYKIVGETESESYTIWPDKKLGPFGAKDKRFQLPGNVGHTIKPPAGQMFNVAPTEPVNVEAIFDHLPAERHSNVFRQVQEDAENLEESILGDNAGSTPSPDDLLECVAHDCPVIMRKDFADLFPTMNIMGGNFTIITISQKTQQDMTGWSEDVEIERETLLESFITGATDICEALNSAGYWADFIDPSSGKPYLGDHTNAALYETDERYRKLGFEIDDLGCCKVIRHHTWGTNSYIGCLFTNAPSTHPILQLMKET